MKTSSVVTPNAIQSIFRYSGGGLAATGAAGFAGPPGPAVALFAPGTGLVDAGGLVGADDLGVGGFPLPLLMAQCSSLFVCNSSKEPILEGTLLAFVHFKMDAVNALCCTESGLR